VPPHRIQRSWPQLSFLACDPQVFYPLTFSQFVVKLGTVTPPGPSLFLHGTVERFPNLFLYINQVSPARPRYTPRMRWPPRLKCSPSNREILPVLQPSPQIIKVNHPNKAAPLFNNLTPEKMPSLRTLIVHNPYDGFLFLCEMFFSAFKYVFSTRNTTYIPLFSLQHQAAHLPTPSLSIYPKGHCSSSLS